MKMEEYIIKKALPGDRHILENIARKAYSPYLRYMHKAPFPMLDDYGQHIGNDHAWILSTGHGVTGYVILIFQLDGSLLLDNVAVEPQYQGLGYGRFLINFAEKYARNQGSARIWLYTNEIVKDNINWYKRLGFKEYDRRMEDGYRRIYFEKFLSS